MGPMIIKFDNPPQGTDSFGNFRQAIAGLKENIELFKESARLQVELKRFQYDELVNAGFTEAEALILVKDGFKP